ncbi:MAG: glycosyltransferase family 4 protein [Akkermansiaceae bacterium]|nr:glycosyltransferase family 4 protein [Akkermansiaceae bacterium]
MINKRTIYVSRLVDAENTNAQVLNTRAMLSRFSSDRITWCAPHYHVADEEVSRRGNVRLHKLVNNGFWRCHSALLYQGSYDAVFYPGGEWFDSLGLLLRKLLRRRIPVIATLEGLVGNFAREYEYSDWAGHHVYCQRVGRKTLARLDRLYHQADHVIAISPFLAEMGRRRYGNKFSVLPLGIDTSVFHAEDKCGKNRRSIVVSAGNLGAGKRPEIFIELARRHPTTDFVWYGGGDPELSAFREKTVMEGLSNLSFPGSVQPLELAKAFRAADLFVMPSMTEGVPKVTQEAAACGLAIVMFGHFEAPSVANGVNGFVVWDDEEFYSHVSQLIQDSRLRLKMGSKAIEMSKDYSWDEIAPRWEKCILSSL